MSTVSPHLSGEALPPPPLPPADPFFYGWRYVTVKLPDGSEDIRQVPLTEEDVLHPQEGDFIVNTRWHQLLCAYLGEVLREHFPDQQKMLVLVDVRVDWEVPQGWAHGPDIGLFANLTRPFSDTAGTFYVKQHGAQPKLIIEATSPSTENNDFTKKLHEYWVLGLPVYVIIDLPRKDDGVIALYGYQRGKREYEAIAPDEKGRLWLAPIGLWIGVEGKTVYFEDADGNRLPGMTEFRDRWQQAQAEAQRAQAEAQRAQAEVQRAQAEAEAAKDRAVSEAEQRAALEARLKEMEAELAALRKK